MRKYQYFCTLNPDIQVWRGGEGIR